MKNYILGDKNNNVFRVLEKSWIARALFVINCIWVYGVVISFELQLFEMAVIILISGIMLLNEILIPFRILYGRKSSIGLKILYIIVVCIVAVVLFRYTYRENVAIIWENILLGIGISIVITEAVVGFVKMINSHDCRSWKYSNVDNMEGHDFEYYCADQLRKKGFSKVEVTQGSGDYGIDVIAWKNNLKYGIQCKRYSGTVGWHAVEEAKAGAEYYACDRAVVLTNNYFTKQAIEGASRIGVMLWNRKWFGDL